MGVFPSRSTAYFLKSAKHDLGSMDCWIDDDKTRLARLQGSVLFVLELDPSLNARRFIGVLPLSICLFLLYPARSQLVVRALSSRFKRSAGLRRVASISTNLFPTLALLL